MVIDFSEMSAVPKTSNVYCTKRTTILPHTETIIWGKVPSNIYYGKQGICTSSKYIVSRGLVISKGVVSVSKGRLIPIKILNPNSCSIDLYKGKTLAMFDEITSEHSLLPFNDTTDHCVQNVNLINDTNSVNSKSDPVKLDSTSDPALGFTDLVKHKILLKPDAKPKYQKPYRLSPDKKDVLRHHLDNLLEQGIISPVFPDEDLPITSPIVLVTKRVHGTKQGPPYDKDSSLSQFRFCCDFRYLNSQCKIFSYNIPDLQDLTESFSQRKPNFITSIDMSSGFFQMKIDPSSSKYTAFNTCFGTYKFNRLPMGLSSAPNSFQLLMDKVLSGLTFRVMSLLFGRCVNLFRDISRTY
ncbi:unnamed protein product [Mytilus edulis]|uniref:Reverse transcriptase domain-containing protein n=1 Tax=Mytilus edulis TaxID=6550 RepID=A0A8S3QT79_MYTED|nr:unnamed protein product [Mytilus edulis]